MQLISTIKNAFKDSPRKLIIGGICILALAFIEDFTYRQYSVEKISQQILQNNILGAATLQKKLNESFNYLESIAKSADTLDSFNKKTLFRSGLFDSDKIMIGRFAWLGFADLQGEVILSSNGMLEGASVKQRPWFKDGLNHSGMHDVHQAELLAKLLPSVGREPNRFIDFYFPIIQNNLTKGVLGAHLSTDWLSQFMRATVYENQTPNDTNLSIYGSDGTYKLGNSLSPALEKEIFSSLSFSKSDEGLLVPSNNPDLIVYFAKLKKGTSVPLEWTLITVASQSQITRTLLWNRLFIALFNLALGIVLFRIFFVKPKASPPRSLRKSKTPFA